MKKLVFIQLLLVCIIISTTTSLKAQDTVSTAGIEFTPAAPTSSADQQATTSAKDSSHAKVSGKPAEKKSYNIADKKGC